jgi:hypothetical protein
MSTIRPINDVLQAHTSSLMAIPGVVGTGVGELKGKPCILVFVRKLDATLKRELPKELEGHPVEIEEVGEVRPVR